ncbi:MAG: phytoene desaturase family protein [Anaerolineales bacterium]
MRSNRYEYDAVVVGAGPNGLAAAVTLARAGCSVLVMEGRDTVGGGTRSAALTLPGFVHDICSAIHPLGVSSPFFRHLPLDKYGLEWIFPPVSLAHPLDDGEAVFVRRSMDETADCLGADGRRYSHLLRPMIDNWSGLMTDLLGPLRLLPRRPAAMMRFGLRALWPARALAETIFRGPRARAVFAGMAGHSLLPLETPLTAAFGVVLAASAHAVGWPLARGGSQSIADALTAYLQRLGGEIVIGRFMESFDELPSARAYLFDVTPRQLLQIAGDELPAGYGKRLRRYRYGVGVFKIDWALDGPIPWRNAEIAQSATVHVGGTLPEIAAAERAVGRSEHPERPYVLLAQQSLFDASRAPAGKHTGWAYCHVPAGSTQDITDAIENQVERFAPGFRDLILARATHNAAQMEQYNPNYVGGDILGGVQDLGQLFTRPVARRSPYTTPNPRIFLCSSSTPPGGGVHGMCGYHAAQAALRRL